MYQEIEVPVNWNESNKQPQKKLYKGLHFSWTALKVVIYTINVLCKQHQWQLKKAFLSIQWPLSQTCRKGSKPKIDLIKRVSLLPQGLDEDTVLSFAFIWHEELRAVAHIKIHETPSFVISDTSDFSIISYQRFELTYLAQKRNFLLIPKLLANFFPVPGAIHPKLEYIHFGFCIE
jgi:hypothetical protein